MSGSLDERYFDAMAEALYKKFELRLGMKQRLLDIEQAAEYLNMSTEGIRNRVAAGELYPTKIDPKWRFDRLKLDAYIERHTEAA